MDMDEQEDHYFSRTRPVRIHDGQDLEVVYTNDPWKVRRVLDMYTEWLKEEDHKFMGLDFEYSNHDAEDEKKIAVIQISMRRHVLVFHYAAADWWESPAIADFFREGITFASVDTRADKGVLWRTWHMKIPPEYYVDLQVEYFKYTGHERAGMSTMAKRLIDSWYGDMKKKFHHTRHRMWGDIPLPTMNIEYAAIDAWVSYELYRKIVIDRALDRRANKLRWHT